MAAGVDVTSERSSNDRIDTALESTRLIVSVAAMFGLFQWSATSLGSDRGQHGLVIAALVVGALLILERLAFSPSMALAARSIGLGKPAVLGVGAAAAICAALLMIPVALRLVGVPVGLTPDWAVLIPGLFAQAGIAEETLFRAFLFGHLRRGRTFWRAAFLSMPPFVAVHLLLFFTMPWPIAVAAVLLSVILSIPLARLFDLGGSTMWAPALVHAVVQGTVKIVTVPDAAVAWFPLLWMAAAATVPLLVFVIRYGGAQQRP